MGSKYYADASLVRLVEDKNIPNLTEEAVLHSIFRNTNISETLQQYYLRKGARRKFDQYFRYGRDHYHYGLLDSYYSDNTGDTTVVKDYIEFATGKTDVQIDYIRYTKFNYVHYGWKVLYEDYGYNPLTNEVEVKSAEHGFTVYLDDFFPVVLDETGEFEADAHEPYADGYWGTQPWIGQTPLQAASAPDPDPWFHIENSATRDGVDFDLIWEDAAGNIFTETVEIDLGVWDSKLDYIQTSYDYAGPNGSRLNGYSIIDPGIEVVGFEGIQEITVRPYTSPGTYWPVLLTHRYGSPVPENNSDEWTTSVALANKLDIDFKQLRDDIHGAANVGDNQIAQAGLLMGITLNTTDSLEKEYLFRWAEAEYARQPETTRLFSHRRHRTNPRLSAGSAYLPGYRLVWRDSDFYMEMMYWTHTVDIVQATIGDEGFIKTTPGTYQRITGYKSNGGGTRNGMRSRGRNEPIFRTDYKLIIEKQLANGLIRRHEFLGLRQTIVAVRRKHAETALLPSDGRFIIPLDQELLKTFTGRDQDILLFKAMHVMVSSFQKVETEWYESGPFKFLIQAIGIILTIITLNPMFAAGTLTLTAIVIHVITLVIGQIVFSYIGNLIAEKLGLEAAAIFAIATIIVGGYRAMNSTTYGTPDAVFADKLIAASTNLKQGVENFMMEEMENLLEEVAAFTEMRDAGFKELDALEADLDSLSLNLDPFTFIGREPAIQLGESPTAFYERTVHTGNPGVQSFKIIENFVDISLTLPTVEDTLGEMTHGQTEFRI